MRYIHTFRPLSLPNNPSAGEGLALEALEREKPIVS